MILRMYRFSFPWALPSSIASKALIIVHALGNFNLSTLSILYSPLCRLLRYPLDVPESNPLDIQYRTCVWSLIISYPQLLNKYYNLIYNIIITSHFPGPAIHTCSLYNSQFTTRSSHNLILPLAHRD